MNRNRRTYIVSLVVLLLSVAILFGTVSSNVETGDQETRFANISHVMEVLALVTTRHYDSISTFDLLRSYVSKGTINGMISEATGDPYTRYMSQEASERFISNIEGFFGGIGIVVGMQEDRLTIVSPIRGTPGERGGLRSQDKIVEIDGKNTTYMSIDEAVGLMRGEPGTPVTITIQRGDEYIIVPIIRDIINVESVSETKMLDDQVGYLQLTNFSHRTHQELLEALDTLAQEGMQALIMDLRFNPGGSFPAALHVVNEFQASGPIVYLEDREGNRTGYDASLAGTRPQMPIVVLINGGSASSSEIVAGALRDNQLATLVGTTTFGKGVVQTVFTLRDGSTLTITEQAYLTAGGYNIDKTGITPDFVVELTEEEEVAIYLNDDEMEDIQLAKALEEIWSKLQ